MQTTFFNTSLYNKIVGTGSTATNAMNMTTTGDGNIRDKGGGVGGASLLSFSGGGGDRGGGGKGRNEKYDNDKDNGKDGIHVRRKFVEVGGVSKGLGTTRSDQ